VGRIIDLIVAHGIFFGMKVVSHVCVRLIDTRRTGRNSAFGGPGDLRPYREVLPTPLAAAWELRLHPFFFLSRQAFSNSAFSFLS
jgi:hypothetical protein